MTSEYDTDFYRWTQQQAVALAAGHVAELDLANLAEEIDSLGRRDRRTLGSRLDVLGLHLLKWRYQPEKRQRGHSWERTILEQRRRIRRLLRDSPSLKAEVWSMIEEEYLSVRRQAATETGLPLTTFPSICPWTVEQLLDDTFFPSER